MATFQETYGLEVVLNGKTYGFTGTRDVTGVTKAVEGNLTAADGTYATLVSVTATAGGNTLATIKKVMIVNNEASTTARVKVTVAAGDEYIRELKAGSVMYIDSANLECKTDGSGFTGFTTVSSISVAGAGATASISFVAAGT